LFCLSVDDFERALEEARRQDRTTAIVVEVDKEARVPGLNLGAMCLWLKPRNLRQYSVCAHNMKKQ
jgi:hypothetical protein